MNEIWNSRGKVVTIDGETRTVVDLRCAYGASIILELDKPLRGKTSPLYTVTPENVGNVTIGYNRRTE